MMVTSVYNPELPYRSIPTLQLLVGCVFTQFLLTKGVHQGIGLSLDICCDLGEHTGSQYLIDHGTLQQLVITTKTSNKIPSVGMEEISPVYFRMRICGYKIKQVSRSKINKRRNCFSQHDVKVQKKWGHFHVIDGFAML